MLDKLNNLRICVSYDIDTWKSRLYFLEFSVWISLFLRTSVTHFLGGIRIIQTNLIKSKNKQILYLDGYHSSIRTLRQMKPFENIVKIVVTEKDRSNVGADKKYAECSRHKKDAYFEEEQVCCMVYFFHRVLR